MGLIVRLKGTGLMAIIVATIVSLALLVVLVSSPAVDARYSNSQAQSQAIDCHADNSGGAPNCANIGPLTQVDGTASSPINLQITGNGEQKQDPPSPPEDTHQTIVTLHDDVEGHAAGWNPGSPPLQQPIIPIPLSYLPYYHEFFTIKSPVELGPSFSIEATFVNPPGLGLSQLQSLAGQCQLLNANKFTNTFSLSCGPSSNFERVQDGAILTYIITK